MSFNSKIYEYFFPSKVYRCACVSQIIDNCYDHGLYSFTEIVDELSTHRFLDNNNSKVFSTKCGSLKKDCIILCEKHLGIVLFAMKKYSCTNLPQETNTTIVYNLGKKETYCTGCIKHYMQLMYHYFYFVDFNIKRS